MFLILSFTAGFEVVTYNNMIGGATASAVVPPVNLDSLAPPKDEPNLSESARSTLSNRSWITEDKWSDEDDEEETAAGPTGFTPAAASGNAVLPVSMLAGNSSLALQVLLHITHTHTHTTVLLLF